MLLCWFCGGQLDALFSGVWPRVDHRGVRHPPQSREGKKAGKYLAGGFYGIVMALIGDLDYMNKFLGLPHWASAANPCNLCLCTKAGPLTWKDSRPNAPWRATTYTTGSWQANPDRSKNPIFDAANISGLSCQSDYMHVKYLGYQQFFLGSVLWLLVHEGCFCLQTIPSLWRTRLGLSISLVCILTFTRVLLLHISYALPLRVLRPWHPSHSCAYLVHKSDNMRKPKTPNKQTNTFLLFPVNIIPRQRRDFQCVVSNMETSK